MTDSKKKKTQPEAEEVREKSVEVVESSENGDQAKAELEALQSELEESRAKAVEYLDGWQRLQAEFINYKKRQERDYESNRITMKADIVKKILPAVDDLERALQHRPADEAAKGWVDGVELVYRKLMASLESEGVTRMDADGQLFDPNFHEAISHEPSDEVESEHIIAVVQPGYMIGERVIRPAMVRVAR
jgi:molecular chaperone GrpE